MSSSDTVVCYPQPGKAKAIELCQAFADGCGGRVSPIVDRHEGPAFFYGIRTQWAHLWPQAEPWYYGDNSYFDATRERYFRVTKNRVQHDGRGKSDGRRLEQLGFEVKPWRKSGDHILVCAQSAEYMNIVAKYPQWAVQTVRDLMKVTQRPIIIRSKGDKTRFVDALENAWMVVTWSSATAVEALLAGVPISCGPECCAWDLSTAWKDIEEPKYPVGRRKWAAVLADNQWSLDEMREGLCWRALCG